MIAQRWLATGRDELYSGYLSKPGRCLDLEKARAGDRDFVPLLTNNDGDIIDEVAVFQSREDAEDVQALYGGEVVRSYTAIGLEQTERSVTDVGGRGLGL